MVSFRGATTKDCEAPPLPSVRSPGPEGWTASSVGSNSARFQQAAAFTEAASRRSIKLLKQGAEIGHKLSVKRFPCTLSHFFRSDVRTDKCPKGTQEPRGFSLSRLRRRGC